MTTEEMQKLGKNGMDAAMSAAGAWNKVAQAIAVEFVEYSKRSAESSAAAWEKLLGAKSLEKAIEVQSEFLRSSTRTSSLRRLRSASFIPIWPVTPIGHSKAL